MGEQSEGGKPINPDRPTLFLDVDEVLNSTRSTKVLGSGRGYLCLYDLLNREDLRANLYTSIPYDDNMSDELVRESSLLDPIAVGLLYLIVLATECQIVISSTWRQGYDDNDVGPSFERMFRAYGYNMEVVGRTPTIHSTGHIRPGDRRIDRPDKVPTDPCRGHEIRWWVEKHGITNYVILDDSSDMLLEQQDRFVCINGRVGIQSEDVVRAVQILKPDAVKVHEGRILLLDSGEEPGPKQVYLDSPAVNAYRDQRHDRYVQMLRKEIGDADKQKARTGPRTTQGRLRKGSG